MLIWYNIVFVFWVQWLILRRHIDLVVGKLVFAEVFEEICVSRTVEVDICVV